MIENKRLVIGFPNLLQIIILIVMGLTAFAVVLLPNGKDPAIFDVFVVVEKVGFFLLTVISVVELMTRRGSILEFLIYTATHIAWSIPVFYQTRWAEGNAILMGFAVFMIVWNAMGGVKGVFQTIRNSFRRSPSDSTDHNHPQADEEIVAVEADEDEDAEEDEPETG